jgi:hypothetical protein
VYSRLFVPSRSGKSFVFALFFPSLFPLLLNFCQKTSDPLFSSAEDPHEWDGSIRLCVDVVVLILVKLAELVRFDQLHRLALVSRVFRAALRRPDVCWRNRWSHWRLQELIPNLMRAEIGMCFASNSRVANWGVPIPITLSELMAGKPVEKDVSVLCVNGAICVSKQAGTMKVERSGVLLCSFDIPSTDCFISSAVASDQDQMIAWLLETPRGIALFCTRFGTAPFVVVKKHAGVFSSFVLLGIGEGFVFVESDSTLRGYEARPGGAVKYSHPLVTRQNWRDRSVVTFLYGSWFCLLRKNKRLSSQFLNCFNCKAL